MFGKKRILFFIISLIAIFALGQWWADKNNPYSKNSWVKPFFTTAVSANGQITLTQSRPLHVLQTPFGKLFLFAESVFRIEDNVYNPEKPFPGNEQHIIDQIHAERFDPTKPYVITGGHFAELYVRNFGVFYNAMLDPRIPTSRDDWTVRQRVTLQTIATDLELLKQAGKEYTTFVPINSDTFVGANFNTAPSDSLFAIVYTLSAATDDTFIADALPTKKVVSAYPLQTKKAARTLLIRYKQILSQAVSQYLSYSISPQTGLIKKDITLASARDGMKRQSSFYDNVIAWATAKDAAELGVGSSCPEIYRKGNSCNFVEWKQHIITVFWDDKEGLFLNDLSADAIKNHTFTGEEFIVVPIHFFDMHTRDDKQRLFRMVTYVKKNNVDKPFPLMFATQNQPDKYYFFVRYFAPSYMGESLWSHAGQEYIESLLLLYGDHPELLQDAQNALAGYKKNIERYGGYPELYDKEGTIFITPFYKSVLHTGWVINYEQAKMLEN